MSGGEQRRVTLARVLALEPKLVVADEPTSGLDPERRDSVLEELIGICPRMPLVFWSRMICQRQPNGVIGSMRCWLDELLKKSVRLQIHQKILKTLPLKLPTHLVILILGFSLILGLVLFPRANFFYQGCPFQS